MRWIYLIAQLVDAELEPLRKQTPDAPHGTASGSGTSGHPCRPCASEMNGVAVVGEGAPARWRLKEAAS
jgi:hypothetical protein